MNDERRFPVLRTLPRRDDRRPCDVPWSLLAPHEAQAMENHGDQTLERLAQRGGLSVREIWAVVHGRRWPDVPSEDVCTQWLNETLAGLPSSSSL